MGEDDSLSLPLELIEYLCFLFEVISHRVFDLVGFVGAPAERSYSNGIMVQLLVKKSFDVLSRPGAKCCEVVSCSFHEPFEKVRVGRNGLSICETVSSLCRKDLRIPRVLVTFLRL